MAAAVLESQEHSLCTIRRLRLTACRPAESKRPDVPIELRAWERRPHWYWLCSFPIHRARDARVLGRTACRAGNEAPAPLGRTASPWCPGVCSSRVSIGWVRTNCLLPTEQWRHTPVSPFGSALVRSARRAALGAARATALCPYL